MKLTLDIAKKIGNDLGVDWEKITSEKWKSGMDVELEHKDVLKYPDNPDMEDYNTIGKIVFAHLKESYKYYEELPKMEKKMNENLELTKGLARKVGNLMGVNWEKTSLDEFFKVMKQQEAQWKYVNSVKDINTDDYLKIAKVAKSFLTEQKLKLAVARIIRENLNNKDFYNRLKYEINKNDADYEKQYNITLGEYGVDSPDQLDNKERNNFYECLNKKLKGGVKPVNEQFNHKAFNKLLKEGKVQKGKIFKEHGVFLTFQELALLEVAPPGREDQVKKLKTKFPKDVAYKIAWQQASDAKSKGNPEGEPKNESKEKTVLMPPDFETEKKVKTEGEEIVEPDEAGKEILKEKDKKEKEVDEVAFSSGLQADRYDKQPNTERTFSGIPGQNAYSEEYPNKNLKKDTTINPVEEE